jgi:hypothetical protein
MFSYLIADINFDCFDPAGMLNKLKTHVQYLISA